MKKAKLQDFEPLPSGDSQYPLEFSKHSMAIKLREDGDEVHVGLAEGDNELLKETIRSFHNQRVVFWEIDLSEFASWLGKLRAEEGSPFEKEGAAEEKLELDGFDSDSPVVSLVNSICIDAINLGASDIHIEAFTNTVVVRYRIDGVLRKVTEIRNERFQALSSRIKIMANLNIMERRLPQDGRMTVDLGGDKVDLRVSIVPIARGESIVLRLFNRASVSLELEQLGYSGRLLEILDESLRIPHGLILVTGPTGSGKTTTLNAVLRRIKSEALKIIAIEDPIEYVIDGIDQIQVNEAIGLSFESLLRRVLRQDPNVIMIGEIRDTATAELSIRAALTGHLVLSTLHTNSSVAVVQRLRNMGVEQYLLASVIKAAIAQRLVRRLCVSCRKKRAPTKGERAIFSKYDIPSDALFEPVGCPDCGGTGFSGRTTIAEGFMIDADIEETLLKTDRSQDILDALDAKGFVTMAEDGLAKVRVGETSFLELAREVTL